MKIKLPFPKRLIGQKFGANAVSLYKGQGLKGHTGIDFSASWATIIPNSANKAYCYTIMNRDALDLMKYRAVFTIVEDGDKAYEISYGHCSTIIAEVGKTYNIGDTIAYVGNTGDAYQAGRKITEKEKEAGSDAGSHLHFQVRACKKVKSTSKGKKYLYNGYGIYKKNGFYYEVINYDNGYHGCVNPMKFVGIDTPYTRLMTLADNTKNPVQAGIIRAVAGIVKAFS